MPLFNVDPKKAQSDLKKRLAEDARLQKWKAQNTPVEVGTQQPPSNEPAPPLQMETQPGPQPSPATQPEPESDGQPIPGQRPRADLGAALADYEQIQTRKLYRREGRRIMVSIEDAALFESVYGYTHKRTIDGYHPETGDFTDLCFEGAFLIPPP